MALLGKLFVFRGQSLYYGGQETTKYKSNNFKSTNLFLLEALKPHNETCMVEWDYDFGYHDFDDWVKPLMEI